MSQVIPSLKDDAARMFDFARHNNPGADLGVIIEKLHHHYCGAITFSEQQNAVENLRQGSQEEATDFLVRVGDAVENLGKDWKGVLSSEELDTLQYTVSLNGVREDIRHILNAEMSKCGCLTPQQMYDAVRNHEVYVSRNKHLEGSSLYTGHPQAPRASQGTSYKPHYQKTTAFATAVVEPEEAPEGYEVTSSGEEGTPESELSSEEQRDVCPSFPQWLHRCSLGPQYEGGPCHPGRQATA